MFCRTKKKIRKEKLYFQLVGTVHKEDFLTRLFVLEMKKSMDSKFMMQNVEIWEVLDLMLETSRYWVTHRRQAQKRDTRSCTCWATSNVVECCSDLLTVLISQNSTWHGFYRRQYCRSTVSFCLSWLLIFVFFRQNFPRALSFLPFPLPLLFLLWWNKKVACRNHCLQAT